MDQGLSIDAWQLGVDTPLPCPNCGSTKGSKLDVERVHQLAHRFFVWGTFRRAEYGGAPILQFNEHRHKDPDRIFDGPLQRDVDLIQRAGKIGFFFYGPNLWMLGEVEPLKALKNPSERAAVVARILREYPSLTLPPTEVFFRLRREPNDPTAQAEYDSAPASREGTGRLDSQGFAVMYGSQDLEVCVHECRSTVDDELYIATLQPTRDLRLLDLTEVLAEKVTPFESLDMAVHQLFLGGSYSYEICRAIAFAAAAEEFDGLVYPSYFSSTRTGAMRVESAYGLPLRAFPSARDRSKRLTIPNLAVFGRPISSGLVSVKCINKVILKRVAYDIQFGPADV